MPPESPEFSPVPVAPSNVSGHDIVSHPFTITFIRIKARQLVRRSDFSKSDVDDLQQDMLLHLLEKAPDFDPDRGNTEAFVTTVVNSWITRLLRDRQVQKRGGGHHQSSLDDAFIESDDSGTTQSLSTSEADAKRHLQLFQSSPIENLEQQEAVRHAIAQLSPEDHDLLMHATWHGVSSAVRVYQIPRCRVEKKLHDFQEIFRNSGFFDR